MLGVVYLGKSSETKVVVLAPFTYLGGLGFCGSNLQATKCVLGGKSRVKCCHLILTPPFRETPNEAKGGRPY